MLPVPIIYLFARKVLIWGADKPIIGKFFSFCLEKGEKGGKKLQAKAGRGLFVALLLFVGIPLPGTGAWTGTLCGKYPDMDFQVNSCRCHAWSTACRHGDYDDSKSGGRVYSRRMWGVSRPFS